MTEPPFPKASGLQVAFLIFAVALLAAPLGYWLGTQGSWTPEYEALAGRLVMFSAAILILVSFPAVRAQCREMLSVPIPPRHRSEVAAVAAIAIVGNFAAAGGIALWLWLQGGEALLASKMQVQSAAQLAKALSPPGLVMIALGWFVGPVIEELVFRGLLYRAWERRWHWLAAMTLTATAFGLYHPFFLGAFAGSILFTCVIRRTGSLWSAIVVHAAGNISLWYPFLGRFVFPSDAGAAITHLSTWWPHIASLVLVLAFLPTYVWMARRK